MQTERKEVLDTTEEKKSQIASIPFKNVLRLDSEGHLDVAATFGEIVKVTYNSSIAEEKETRKEIQGNLRVSLARNSFIIESDNPKEDLPQLQKLTPWLGRLVEPGAGIAETPNGIRVNMQAFDHFISPYVQEFISLTGHTPFEALLFNLIAAFFQPGQQLHLYFDEKLKHFFVQDLKSGDVESLRATFGPHQFGHPLSPTINFICDLEGDIAQARSWQKKNAKGKLLKALREDAREWIDHFDIRYPEGAKRNLLYLLCFIDKLKELYSPVESLNQECISTLTAAIIDHLSIVPSRALTGTISELESQHLENVSAASFFHNLLELPDLNIQRSVLRIIKESNIDLNDLSFGPHPLIYLFPSISEIESGNLQISQTSLIASPREKGEFIRSFFAAGGIITPEVQAAIEEQKIDSDIVPMIKAANFLQFQAILETLSPFLARDPKNTVLGYLFDVKTVEAALSAQWRPPTTSIVSVSQTLFSAEKKPSSRQEAKLCELFEAIKSHTDTTKSVAEIVQPWLAQASDYVASLEKSVFIEKKSLSGDQKNLYEGFKQDLRKTEEGILQFRSDDASALKVLTDIQSKIPDFLPPVLQNQINEIVDKMQRRFAPEPS